MQRYDGSMYLPKSNSVEDEWKEFMKFKKYHVWRKKVNNTGKYMYRSKYLLLFLCGIKDREIDG